MGLNELSKPPMDAMIPLRTPRLSLTRPYAGAVMMARSVSLVVVLAVVSMCAAQDADKSLTFIDPVEVNSTSSCLLRSSTFHPMILCLFAPISRGPRCPMKISHQDLVN